ncbi:MAG TPA: hypothetical protein VNW97_09345 [Candidatus Saccharimonadales bacterium]|jgi:O-antigen ligase|nr:hypothetical protein [Candidatus Saccharimonadales bacterium]
MASGRALHPSVPDPTPLLYLITVASVLLFFADDLSWTALLLPCIVLLPSMIYLLSSNLAAAAGVLIAASVMSRFFVEISSLKARPEHIAVGLLCCLVPFVMKRQALATVWGKADLLLLVYVGLNILSSGFTSPDPSQTLRWAIQQGIAILPYFLLRLLAADETAFRRIFHLFLWIGVVQAAYAIVCFFSNRIFSTEFGMALDQYGDIPGTYGLQLEPNLLGSYSSACLVMLLVSYFVKPTGKLLAGIGITYAAAAISLSRAAVAGAGLAVLVMLYWGKRLQIIRKDDLIRVGVTVLAISLFLSPIFVSMYVERFKTLNASDIEEDTLTGRVVTGALAVEDIVAHPLLGTGTSSFQVTLDSSLAGPEASDWIANSELRIVHDTGILGFGVFLAFLFFLYVPCWRLLKRKFHLELMALMVASLVYCVSFQATEGTLLAFCWVHLGLIGCGLTLRSAASGVEIQPQDQEHTTKAQRSRK